MIGAKVREGIMRARRDYPVHANRASSLGHPCIRYLYYQRTAHEIRELPDIGLLEIWEEGNDQERSANRLLRQYAGLEIIESQRELTIKEHNITGHIDGKVVPVIPADYPDWPKDERGELIAVPAEIKSMDQHIFAGIETLDNMANSDHYWIRGYLCQLQIYLEGTGQELGVFLLKPKNASRIRDIWAERDEAIIQDAFRKADAVEFAVGEGDAPERCEGSHCRRCPFLTHCTPDIINTSATEFMHNPELEDLLDQRHRLLAAGKEFEKVDRQIKKMLEGVEKSFICGDHLVTGKPVERKGYTVEAGTSWRRSIEYIGEEEVPSATAEGAEGA